MNEYGNGRIAAIDEMITWIEKSLKKVQNREGDSKDTHKTATKGGIIKAYKTALDYAKMKRKRTVEVMVKQSSGT